MADVLCLYKNIIHTVAGASHLPAIYPATTQELLKMDLQRPSIDEDAFNTIYFSLM